MKNYDADPLLNKYLELKDRRYYLIGQRDNYLHLGFDWSSEKVSRLTVKIDRLTDRIARLSYEMGNSAEI